MQKYVLFSTIIGKISTIGASFNKTIGAGFEAADSGAISGAGIKTIFASIIEDEAEVELTTTDINRGADGEAQIEGEISTIREDSGGAVTITEVKQYKSFYCTLLASTFVLK